MRQSTSSSPKPGRVGGPQVSVIDRQSATTNVRGRINSGISLPSTDHVRYLLRSELALASPNPRYFLDHGKLRPLIRSEGHHAPADVSLNKLAVSKTPGARESSCISVSAFLPLTTGLSTIQHPSTRRPQYTDLIQAMIFQRSSSVLIISPKCGIGPTTASEPFRR